MAVVVIPIGTLFAYSQRPKARSDLKPTTTNKINSLEISAIEARNAGDYRGLVQLATQILELTDDTDLHFKILTKTVLTCNDKLNSNICLAIGNLRLALISARTDTLEGWQQALRFCNEARSIAPEAHDLADFFDVLQKHAHKKFTPSELGLHIPTPSRR